MHNLICANFQEFQIQRYHSVGSVISVNRNKLVRAAQEAEADYLLQVDADSVFPATALKRLFEHNRSIVGATTTARDGRTTRPMCQPIDPNVKVMSNSPLIPVKLIGMNFMLIKMDVFDKIPAPWFAEPPRNMMFKELSLEEQGLPELVGEDEFFCTHARQAGYEVLCDMVLSMEMGHIGSKPFFIERPEKQALNIITS